MESIPVRYHNNNRKVAMKEKEEDVLVLTSNHLISAPGLMRWAMAGYEASSKHDKIALENVILSWEDKHLTRQVVREVLTKKRKVDFTKTTVRITLGKGGLL